MNTIRTSRDVNPETATEDEILAGMAGDAEASAHENGTLLTEALPRIAAEQARIHDLLQREGLDTMARPTAPTGPRSALSLTASSSSGTRSPKRAASVAVDILKQHCLQSSLR